MNHGPNAQYLFALSLGNSNHRSVRTTLKILKYLLNHRNRLPGLQRKKQFNKHHRIKLNNVFCHKIDAGRTSFSRADHFFLPLNFRFFF